MTMEEHIIENYVAGNNYLGVKWLCGKRRSNYICLFFERCWM